MTTSDRDDPITFKRWEVERMLELWNSLSYFQEDGEMVALFRDMLTEKLAPTDDQKT